MDGDDERKIRVFVVKKKATDVFQLQPVVLPMFLVGFTSFLT